MSSPIIKIKQGQLKGKQLVTKDGKAYFGFLGIPYAEPPLGKLRFKDPQPSNPWQGVKDATKEGNKSMQFDVKTQEICGSEDCLYLNVFTPNYGQNNLFPVIIYIHGGGFAEGSGNREEFGPDYIIEKDVVFVSINYRLGVLGYLCTDPINARGDMGLNDQNLALKWVQDNIKTFGGDSNNVTLMGTSAGASSVEYHILSPKSKGLFHKAIMQSGSALNPFARTLNPIEVAERLAKCFGYKKGANLFECINNVNSFDLVNATKDLTNINDVKEAKFYPFIPVINFFKDYDGFLNEEPRDLLKKGKFNQVPIICGIVECELSMLWKQFYYMKDAPSDLRSGKIAKYIPSYLNKPLKDCDIQLREIYVRNEQDYSDRQIAQVLSDIVFNGGICYSLSERIKHNHDKEYFYYFSYDGNMNLGKVSYVFKEKGAIHNDEVGYLGTSAKFNYEKVTEQDLLVKSRMVQMWTDFVKFGDPTPKLNELINTKWLPNNDINDLKCLNIYSDLLLHNYPTDGKTELWLKINSL